MHCSTKKGFKDLGVKVSSWTIMQPLELNCMLGKLQVQLWVIALQAHLPIFAISFLA